MLIAQITDLHLGFEPGNAGELNRQRLDMVVAKLAALDPRPDMLLATGDLTDRGDSESYERLRDALSPLPFPVHFLFGNHDLRATFRAAFPEARFCGDFLQYSIEGGAIRILALDTLEEGLHGGGFCEKRAEWLRERLDEHPDSPTLIALHHPPIVVGIDWMDPDPNTAWIARLEACLEGRGNVVALICGHIHRAVTARFAGTAIATCPSTAPQLALDLRPVDPATPDGRDMIIADAPGYALHWWNGRELVTHWDSAGDRTVIARFDPRLQAMLHDMMTERSGSGSP